MKRRGAQSSTHFTVLDELEKQVSARLEQHRVKTGDGMPHDEYLKHVGRIAEAKAVIKEIADLRKRLRTDDDL